MRVPTTALALALLLLQTASTAGRSVELRRYAGGQVESLRVLRAGTDAGTHVTWWPDGTPRSFAEYDRGALHGEYRTWYPDGRPYERRRFARGREAGLQQAWAPSGDMLLNYEIDGRRSHGFVSGPPCVAAAGPEVHP